MSSQGFSSGLNKAAAETEAFGTKLKRGANNVFEFGGALGTLNKGWTIFKDVLSGFGLAVGENIIKALGEGISALFGYDKAAEEAKKKTDAFIGSLREQADMINLNAIEAARYKAVQLGASKEQVIEAEDLARYIEGQKKVKAMREEVEKTISALKEERDVFGMSAAELLNRKLEMNGATTAQKRFAEELRAEIALLKEREEAAKEAAKEMAQMQEEATRAEQDRARMAAEFNKQLMERNEAIASGSYRTAQQPQLVEYGTQAAFKRISEATNAGKSENQKQTKILEDINKGIRDMARRLGVPEDNAIVRF